MPPFTGLVVLALSAFAVFFALGGIVAHRPPTDIEYLVHNALYGKSVAVAVKLTTVGRFPAYLAASLLSIVIAFGVAALATRCRVRDRVAARRVAGERFFQGLFRPYPAPRAARLLGVLIQLSERPRHARDRVLRRVGVLHLAEPAAGLHPVFSS